MKLIVFGLLYLLANIASAATVTLAWDSVNDSRVAGYRLYMSTQSGIYSNPMDVGLYTSAAVPSLVEGQTYYFVVTAYTADIPMIESTYSNEVYTTIPIPPPPVLTVDFTASATSGKAPFMINFVSSPSSAVNYCYWKFGDRKSSYSCNPAHTYKYRGVYTVTLTVKDSTGQKAVQTKNQYITVQ